MLVGGAALQLGAQQASEGNGHRWTIVVHGGAGVIERAALGPEGDLAYRASLTKGIEAGSKVLDSGGSAVDAVEAVLKVFEDDPCSTRRVVLYLLPRGSMSSTHRSWTDRI